MMQRLNFRLVAQAILLLLLLGMPFHAFFSVWLGSLTHHQAIIQSWKEVLIVVLSGLTAIIAWREPQIRARLRQPWVIAVYVFVIIGLLVSLVGRTQLVSFAFGIKTDAEFLVAGVCAYVLADRTILKRAETIILATAGIVAAFGTLQALVLPRDVLSHFGYGAMTILSFESLTTQVTSFRILSTLGGPNQLGSYLVLPICLVIGLAFKRPRWWQPILLGLAIISLWHTYSRSAWIATIVAILITSALTMPRSWRLWAAIGSLAFIAVGGAALGYGVARHSHLESYVLHGSLQHYGEVGSDAERLESQRQGLRFASAHPLGLGFGSSGPASKHGLSYNVTENYYLQLSVEVGVLGLVAFAATCLLLARDLSITSTGQPIIAALIGTLAGISLINLFLHGWADSSTAIIFWIMAGLALGAHSAVRHKSNHRELHAS